VNLGRRWYLLGWDRGREDWRTFRVDRLSDPAATGRRFTQRALPAKDAAAYVEQSISGASSRYEARVTVHAPMEEVARRHPYAAGSLRRIDAHRCQYRTSDDNLDWLAIRIALLGVDVDVHEPPELIAQIDVLAQRLQRAT
jgi:predicted DNA-binding transcriptional regulator YafY